MTEKLKIATALAALLVLPLTSACSDGSSSPGAAPSGTTAAGTGAPGTGPSRVVLLGDSVAGGQALPLGAALAAGGVEFRSLASDGGGSVVGPVAEEVWTTLPARLEEARPGTVVYQITTYDWGAEKEQRAGYERLLDTVAGTGAKLVLVTMPPIKADDFYAPHMKDLARAPQVARAVAEASQGRATFLDASDVWGTTYRRTRNGKVDRSSDGIHTCQQGAARFTSWLLTELTDLYPGFTPPSPEKWANTGWTGDDRFVGC